MKHTIDRAAVLGAGVMGAALAAHLANAGIPSLLLDIVPPEGSDVDGDPSSRAYRDAFARGGLERALKARPAAFYTKEKARLVETGNFEDDLDKLRDAEWVIEAVVERLDIKQSLFARIEPYISEDAVLTSNTSGISVEEMAQGLGDSLRRRFFVTHFFNPPRYMRLLEIVPHSGTDAGVMEPIVRIGEDVLGKGIVYAKDTPNFIANRIGCFSMVSAFRAMLDGGYTVEEVDALTGPAIGRPKSASFRTADLVGLDTLAHACKTVYDRADTDERREMFELPEFFQNMVKEGMLGEKSGMGFYKKTKKNGQTEILTLDYDKLEYRPREKAKFASIEMTRNIDDPGERIKALVAGKDRGSEFLWRVLSETLVYSAQRLGEIADDVVNVDNAMKWGYNWELGPFEIWDAIGVEEAAERMQKDGQEIPAAVSRVLATDARKFYPVEDGHKRYYFRADGAYAETPEREATVELGVLKARNKVLKKNAGASLIDIGDEVLCLEFHSKMNAIGGDIIGMIQAAVKETEANFKGLVIGNEGAHFSVGANLMLLLLEAQDANWEEIDLIVRAFQKANMALKYCKRPVVAAPFGMALGGGCEVCLGANHINAAAETYMGLVEIGVGLIPAGGGCKEMLLRNLEGVPHVDGVDIFPHVRAAFETVGMAKVSMSGEEARALRFLRPEDGITLNPGRLIHDAKATVLGLANRSYRPPDPADEIPVVGEGGMAAIKTQLYMFREGKFISEYDEYLGGELARVLCGGRVAKGTTVSEQYLLDLEREVFLRLCGQRKTQERMQFMLKKGKPLRN